MPKTFVSFLVLIAITLSITSHSYSEISEIKEDSAQAISKPAETASQPESISAQLSELSKLKSSSQAFAFSIVLPGSGELYSEAKRGYVFLLTEGAFWAGFFLKNRKANEVRDQYKAYVRDHVKFDEKFGGGSFDKWDLEDYEHTTIFDNWRNVYTEEDDQPKAKVGAWYWEDDDFKDRADEKPESAKREEALKLRNDSNKIFKTARTFAGLAIFNHVVSAIDARIAAKLYNEKLQGIKTSLQIHPESGEIREEVKLTLEW